MKKTFLLLAGATMLSFANAGAEVLTTAAKKATSAITVDGVLNETDWSTATKVKVGKVYTGETITDSADCSAYFQTLWCDSGVFVAVTVTDNILGMDLVAKKYGPDWAQDLAEVYFDMNYLSLKDGKGPGAGAGHYASADPAIDTIRKAKENVWAYKHTGDNANYIKEVYFAWNNLKDASGNVFVPDSSIALGFDVTVADNDHDSADVSTGFRNRLEWSNAGPNEDYGNMNDAGRITFPDAHAVVPTPEAKSTKTTAAIVVDGDLAEAAWATAPKYDVLKVYKGEKIAGGASDCSAYFQTLWCDSGVFVAVTVTDDVLGMDLNAKKYGPDWAQDLAEVYFDMNSWGLKDGKGPGAGAGHYASADPGIDTIRKANGNVWAYKHSGVNGNYVKEVYFAWANLKDADGNVFTPDSKISLGFDVTVADNDHDSADVSTSFRNRLEWSNDGPNEDYGNMDAAGRISFAGAPTTANLTATSVPATAAIVLDGKLTDADWKTAHKYRLGKTFKGEVVNGPADCSAFFQTVWADSGVFVAVTVTDDIKGITLGSKVYGESWSQDLVEVYFDMNLGNLKDGKGVAYGKGHYCSAEAGKDTVVISKTGFSYAYKHSTATGGNYIKEVFVPWTFLKDSTGALFTDNTKPLGFDVCVSDNDTSQADKSTGFRNRIMWSNIGTINEDYSNMDDAGRLIISGIPNIPSSVVSINATGSLTVFPNPASNFITLKTNSNEALPMTIYSVTGQIVLKSVVANNQQVNISKLEKGVYFVSVSSKNNISTGKLIKK